MNNTTTKQGTNISNILIYIYIANQQHTQIKNTNSKQAQFQQPQTHTKKQKRQIPKNSTKRKQSTRTIQTQPQHHTFNKQHNNNKQ